MTKEFTLPDGNVIKISTALFKCPELLFNPELHGKETKSINKLLYDSIQSCDIDIRSDLYSNVVLSGGSTMF
jgi:actin-related protein